MTAVSRVSHQYRGNPCVGFKYLQAGGVLCKTEAEVMLMMCESMNFSCLIPISSLPLSDGGLTMEE